MSRPRNIPLAIELILAGVDCPCIVAEGSGVTPLTAQSLMDALDGGHWEFGDASVPTVGVTYFAGTFVRHPLALSAVRAVLHHLKEQGPALQRTTNAKAERLAKELNAFFREDRKKRAAS